MVNVKLTNESILNINGLLSKIMDVNKLENILINVISFKLLFFILQDKY